MTFGLGTSSPESYPNPNPSPNPNPNPNPNQVQQYKRSVIVTWDGAVEPMDFMVTAPTLRPLVATAP